MACTTCGSRGGAFSNPKMKPTYTGKRLASVVANQTEEFCGEVTVLDDGSTGSGMPLWLMLALAVGGASIFLL